MTLALIVPLNLPVDVKELYPMTLRGQRRAKRAMVNDEAEAVFRTPLQWLEWGKESGRHEVIELVLTLSLTLTQTFTHTKP